MMSKRDSKSVDASGDSNAGQLLHDIEEISKALYLPKPVRSVSAAKIHHFGPNPSQNSRDLHDNVTYKDKKSLFLHNWKKPLKALTHIRYHRLNGYFFLHIHSIEGLPSTFNGFSLCVSWKRKIEVLTSRPSRVWDGFAEYEETLMHKCNVRWTRRGPYNSAKYKMKLCLVYPYIVGAPGLDLGKNWIDLTRLLPVNLKELESGNCSGKWATSFKLDGKAKGATLNVSFGFLIPKDDWMVSGGNFAFPNFRNLLENQTMAVENGEDLPPENNFRVLQRFGSVSNNFKVRSNLSSLSIDLMLGREVMPNSGLELPHSISILYQKLNEGSCRGSVAGSDAIFDDGESPKDCSKLDFDYSLETDEFSVDDHGVELCQKESDCMTIHNSAVETIDVEALLKDYGFDLDGQVICHNEAEASYSDLLDGCYNKQEQGAKDTETRNDDMENLDTASHKLLGSRSTELETQSSADESVSYGKYMEIESQYRSDKASNKSRSLDDYAESVANELFDLLETDDSLSCMESGSVPESPRERLLREFENEVLSSGNFILDLNARGWEAELGSVSVPNIHDTNEGFALSSDEGFTFSSVIQSREEHKMVTTPALKHRRKFQVLEKLETEALMCEWGLNDEAFQSSPCIHSDGFRSPVELPKGESSELQQLGYDFGHLLCTKGEGCSAVLTSLSLIGTVRP